MKIAFLLAIPLLSQSLFANLVPNCFEAEVKGKFVIRIEEKDYEHSFPIVMDLLENTEYLKILRQPKFWHGTLISVLAQNPYDNSFDISEETVRYISMRVLNKIAMLPGVAIRCVGIVRAA